MKKLLLILLCLPIIGFGQLANTQIIKIEPSSLLFGELSLAYEIELDKTQSLSIGLPIYFKIDIYFPKEI